jgi:hypothetical protein
MFLFTTHKETSMSWSAFPLTPVNVYEPRPAAIYPLTYPLTVSIRQLENSNQLRHLHELSSLGSAWAGTSWQWAGRSAEATSEEARPSVESRESMEQSVTVSVPARIKLKMAQIARTRGRSEDDLWAEAANNWLHSHTFDDDPLPPAPAAALAVPKHRRSWETIDELLSSLRQPTMPDRIETQRAA